MKKIRPGYILPSAAITVPPRLVRQYEPSLDRAPRVGDLVYGRIQYIGEHSSLENKHGRIHEIHDATHRSDVREGPTQLRLPPVAGQPHDALPVGIDQVPAAFAKTAER